MQAQLFLGLCSETSPLWQLEISHGESIFTTEIGKYYQAGLFLQNSC